VEDFVEAVNSKLGSPEPLESRIRGTNQSGMRDYNERLVLSLLRRHGALAKSDIARMTGLSAQTVSVIMRGLEAEEFLLRHEPIRGRVGQPSVPMALNPDAAYFLGLKIGRRSAELVLIDFLGNVRSMLHSPYPYPAPHETMQFLRDGIETMRESLTAAQNKRIAGLGIAMPSELWNWRDAVGAPSEAMDGWRDRAIRTEIQAEVEFPVYLQNDATSACGAELVFGLNTGLRDFVYFYIGAFAGGGVVLDGRLYDGPSGNAGALGSMPVPGPDGKTSQLIDIASIARLERMLAETGKDGSHLWTSPEDWGDIGPALDEWLGDAGNALAYAIAAASSVIDFEAAIIDGWMPAAVRTRLVARVVEAIARIDAEGLTLPVIRPGTVGIHARALGAASLPLSERFMIGANLLSKRH
jgi:predicted NBD/HSP70 family sugar kinase